MTTTIPRNHTKRIAAAIADVVRVTRYNRDKGENEPSTLAAAMAALRDPNAYGPRFYDNENGTYTIHLHSNLWYSLFTQDAVNRLAAEQAARDAKRAARPTVVTETREQRHARIMERTTSIHDLGKTAPAAAPGMYCPAGASCSGKAFPGHVAHEPATPAEPTAADIVKAMNSALAATVATAKAEEAKPVPVGKWYLIPAKGERLTDRHDLLGPYNTESLAEHMLNVYAHAGIPAVVVRSVTRPVFNVAPLPGWIADVDRAHRLALAWNTLVTLAPTYGGTPEELGARAVDEPWKGLATMRRTPDGFEFTDVGWASHRAREKADAWDAAHEAQAVRFARLPESSTPAEPHPNETAALRALRMMPTSRWRELFCEPGMVMKTTPEQHITFRWLTTALEDRFPDAAYAAQEVMLAAEVALQAAGPDAVPEAFVVDYVGEILTRIPFLARREHDVRDGYGCLSAADSGLPDGGTMSGWRARCLCGRLWVLREDGRSVVWAPVTTFKADA